MDIKSLVKENEKLKMERDELSRRMNEANEVIESIKKGNIDAVFSANNETAKVLVANTADQTYRKFIENMSEGVVTLQPDGIILYSNSSFAKMVDLPLENVIGANCRNFIPTEHLEKFEHFFKEYPTSNSKIELSILMDTGRRTHFIISLNTLQLMNFVALNLVWTDVTDQKEAEEKLITLNENLNKAIEERTISEEKVVILNKRLKGNIKILEEANVELGAFAHIASHDLQEPLRKMQTYGGILISEYYDVIDQEGKNYINKINNASTRMRSLINDILEYSQLSKINVLFKPADLQSIVNEIISDLEIVISDTKANITIEKELPVFEANASQMTQLFQNIISNALKFIKAGRTPEISIDFEIIKGSKIMDIDERRLDENFFKFYIRDNGIGFKPAYANKIFTIFQKLNSNALYTGTGIGLAICKKIVEKHNGFISAESILGEGSLFTITLPVSQNHLQKKNYDTEDKKSLVISPDR